MTVGQGAVTPKPLRADARRNRDAILQAAREVFESEGVLASLDGIALRAGVGNATLYRNFPTRDDLLMAFLEVVLDEARAQAAALVAGHTPREALGEWLVWLTWRLRIWHDLPHCVAEACGDEGSSMNPAIALLTQLTGDVLARAQAAGVAVRSVGAGELFELATAISWAVDRFGDDEASARRRVELMISGLLA